MKWLLASSSVATGVTGIVYAWMKYLMEPSQPWAVINHPLQPWMLKAHILVAPVLVFAFGLIAVEHAWKHFRCLVPAGRRSGILAGALFAPMVVSGYLIQVVTHTGWLRAMVWAHLVSGAVYLVAFLLHQRIFRRGRSARPARGRRRRRERPPEAVPRQEGRPRGDGAPHQEGASRQEGRLHEEGAHLPEAVRRPESTSKRSGIAAMPDG